jgi:uncharacterized protein with GYD domain
MPTFICFLNWTEQGVKNAKDAGKRHQAAKAMAEKLGGRVLSTYVTTGQYDVVATVEMPSGEAMAKFATAVAASGNARTTTVRAFSPRSSPTRLHFRFVLEARALRGRLLRPPPRFVIAGIDKGARNRRSRREIQRNAVDLAPRRQAADCRRRGIGRRSHSGSRGARCRSERALAHRA